MKKIIFPLIIFVGLFSFQACDPENVIGVETDDVVDSDTLDYVWDTANVVKIYFNETSIDVNSEKVTVNNTILTINQKGTYYIYGTLTNGQVIVNSTEKGIVRLVLYNMNLTSTTTSPLLVEQATKTIVILPQGSANTITDGTSYIVTEDSLNAAIYSRDYLAFYGEGKLVVNGNYNAGISARDELVIQSGEIEVNAVGFGIKGKDYLKIYDGIITVNSGADALKSDNDSLPEYGYINIEGGTFNLISACDAISAFREVTITGGTFNITTGGGSTAVLDTTISTKGIKAGEQIMISGGVFTINSCGNSIDADNDIVIDNGTFVLSSANKAIDCDSTLIINNGDIQVTQSIKGIGAHHITINGGNVKVNSENDCIKATLGTDLTTDDGSLITITNGTILLDTYRGDALDSNGDIDVTGGTLVVQGSPKALDEAISSRGKLTVSGGNIVASGATSVIPQSSSVQNSVFITLSLKAPGTLINVQDQSGTTIMTYQFAEYAYSLFLSFPELTSGVTYDVYTGGSTTGTVHLNGYYTNGTYTPGIKIGSFTVSGKVTQVSM